MPSLFKYPGQTTPIKISPVNAWVRPAKPAKREKGKGRRGERTRDGKISVAREGRRERKDEEREGEGEREERERGERKTFLLPPLLATEIASVARRHEERGEGRCRGREKRTVRERERRGKMSREREKRERIGRREGGFSSRLSSRRNFRRERERGEGRETERRRRS